MDPKICEQRGCYALFWKNTKAGKKLACLCTDRNVILDNIIRCERATSWPHWQPELKNPR